MFVVLLAHLHSTANCIIYYVTNSHFKVGKLLSILNKLIAIKIMVFVNRYLMTFGMDVF